MGEFTDYSGFEGRNRLELIHWPEFWEPFTAKEMVIFAPNGLGPKLKLMVFTVCSVSGGCFHCQAHGGTALAVMLGVEPDEIRDLWEFEQSDRFDEAEKSALRFGRDAGYYPNAVTAQHYKELRRYYDDQQIRELLAVVSEAAFLNRYSETAAVITDQPSKEWATEHLTKVGWQIGRHIGPEHEQRKFGPGSKIF